MKHLGFNFKINLININKIKDSLLSNKKIIEEIGSKAYESSIKKFLVKDSCKKLEKYLSL